MYAAAALKLFLGIYLTVIYSLCLPCIRVLAHVVNVGLVSGHKGL
jgi:hypothetical protein